VLTPDSVDQGLHRFRLHGPAREIRLLSRAAVPAVQDPRLADTRRLGVSLWWVRLRGSDAAVEIHHDHPKLMEGFHEVEPGARWTDGFSLLPASLYGFLTGEIAAEVKIGAPDMLYPVPPEAPCKRALVIDEAVPTPDRDAGSNVILAHMRLLQSLGYAITFLPANLAAPSPYAGALTQAGIELAAQPLLAGIEHLIALRGPSFALAYVHRVTVAERVIPLLRRYAPQARILFNNADMHFLRLRREAEVTGSEALHQAAEDMRRRELQVFAAADASLLCNAREMELLRLHVPDARTVYLPWVIGPQARSASGFADREGIMFLGGFAHRPNPDAVIWFVTEVMPLLRPLVPGMLLHVYGHGVPDAVQSLAGPDVMIEGHVADLAGAFARHRLSIAPLRFGAGFKGKLAESLAHGVPAVATGIAAEGTDLVDGEHLLVADDAGSFAHAVARLHTTPTLWQRLAVEGHRFVLAAFSEERGRDRMREALRLAGLPDAGAGDG
jgi:glycosyltransferase involved in cell wall biosynthesis